MAKRAGARRTIEIPGASHAITVSHPDAPAHMILDAAWRLRANQGVRQPRVCPAPRIVIPGAHAVAADQGLTLFTYAAEPSSRSEEALNLLGSWAATVDLAESPRTTDQV